MTELPPFEATIVKDIAPGFDALRFNNPKIVTEMDVHKVDEVLQAYTAERQTSGSKNQLVIDFKEITDGKETTDGKDFLFISSSAFKALVRARKLLRPLIDQGKEPIVIAANPASNIGELLQITRLNQVFPLVESVKNPVPIQEEGRAGGARR